jgi:TonB family protein
VREPPPIYPEPAYRAGIEGVVTLGILITPDGAVTNVEAIKAEPPGWFDEAARRLLASNLDRAQQIAGTPSICCSRTK